MNITNAIVAIIVAIIFFFVANLVLAAIGFALPPFVVALVAILIGIVVYKHGVSL